MIAARPLSSTPTLSKALSSLAALTLFAGCSEDVRGGEGSDPTVGASATNANTSDGSGGTTEGTTTGDERGVEDESGVLPEGGCRLDEQCEAAGMGGHCDAATGTCYPECTPGDTMPCYTGPEATENVGTCQSGENVCPQSGIWDSTFCEGEITPALNDCDDNGQDDDCDGAVDNTIGDADGDGYGACIDCCDVVGQCSNPALVNPGAYEVVGNDLDDNCNGEIDEEPVVCDGGLSETSREGLDYAFAMDLCQTTEEAAQGVDKTWGVISARLSLADGTGSPDPQQTAIPGSFGVNNPLLGDAFATLSTGLATAGTDNGRFQFGEDMETRVPAPADWLAANNGEVPNPAECPPPELRGGDSGLPTDANDSAMLTLRVRAPTNANSFSVRMFFMSSEFPEWVCSRFADFFVTLIRSDAEGNPDDGNIATYLDDNDVRWPVGVNLTFVAEGLFAQCENSTMACHADDDNVEPAEYTSCESTDLLAGTGFDLRNPDDPDEPDRPDYSQPWQGDHGRLCAPDELIGGGTGWLTMSGNVEPGEVFEVRFVIWDATGHLTDSLVILDEWEWSVEAATSGVIAG